MPRAAAASSINSDILTAIRPAVTAIAVREAPLSSLDSSGEMLHGIRTR